LDASIPWRCFAKRVDARECRIYDWKVPSKAKEYKFVSSSPHLLDGHFHATYLPLQSRLLTSSSSDCRCGPHRNPRKTAALSIALRCGQTRLLVLPQRFWPKLSAGGTRPWHTTITLWVVVGSSESVCVGRMYHVRSSTGPTLLSTMYVTASGGRHNGYITRSAVLCGALWCLWCSVVALRGNA
jgi:hypothetical protein